MLNEYKPLDYTDTIFSVMVVFLFISIIFITYYIKAKKSKPNIAPKGFVLLMQIYFEFIDNMVAQVMGKKGSKITPYIVFLFTYLFFSNTIGIFGLSTPTGQLGVNISLALITFFGTFAFGFKYQKISYLKKYCFCCKIKGKKIPLMINPISFISMITPVISLSFRLWGNLLAGEIVITLWLALCMEINEKIPFISTINLIGGFTVFPLKAYFDIFAGAIQAYIFSVLTLVYWYMAKGQDVAKDEYENIQLLKTEKIIMNEELNKV